MKKIYVALFPVLLVFITASPGLSATASEQSCSFVKSYLDSKPNALKALRDIFGRDENSFQMLVEIMTELPDKFEDGRVVEIANVGDLLVEHFIVLNKENIGNIYFRFVYEKSGTTMLGVKFLVNSDVEPILKDWPMLQNPVDIGC